MPEHNKPHPMNVAGDFYVVDQCCTACGVPTYLAPGTFVFVSDSSGAHCYVQRQPATPVELERALRVVRHQEFGCVRYRGTDPVILRRLTEAGEGAQCDAPLPLGVHPVLRDHVSVEAQSLEARSWEPATVLERFRLWLMGQAHHYRTTSVVRTATDASFSFAWTAESFHEVRACPWSDAPGRWLLHHSGNIAVSEALAEWLESADELGAAQWFSQEEWKRGLPGHDRPW